MKEKYRVTIERWTPTALDPSDRIYRIVKIRGAVGIFCAGNNRSLYRVGDKITEKVLEDLFDNSNNDITVTV